MPLKSLALVPAGGHPKIHKKDPGKMAIRNPQPATRNPQLATRNSQLATRNSQPATRKA